MKAILFRKYGGPEVLQLVETHKGGTEDGKLLVKVRAASLNAMDWHLMRGSPFLARLMGGLLRPKDPRVGVDFSGTVESVGKGVTEFHPGDDVFGGAFGSCGEYVSVEPKGIVPKPPSLSHELAASVPLASITAIQALRDRGQLRPGERVLINGAGGGVGTFAVQIAKALGAHVTAATTPENAAMVRSIGADEVIDYTHEDFTRGGERFDLIVDTAPRRSISAYKRALRPGGRCVIVGWGGMFRLLAFVVRGKLTRKTANKKLGMFIAKRSKEDLLAVRELVLEGKVVPVLDRRFNLSEVPQAMEYLETERARGKIVITVSTNPD
ncbi:MAG: NAD(P)-dependent alcohol dehydrogenase [Candidatus Lutacidiplasmatales archaeon]